MLVNTCAGLKYGALTLLACSLPSILLLRHPLCARFVPRSYAALLADWPVVVLGMCTLLIVVCALVGVLVPELPDFSDPLLVRRTWRVMPEAIPQN